MMRSMYTAVSGLRTHQGKMDTIGNNIANVNTVGFKRSQVTFKEAFSQMLTAASGPQGGRGGTNPQQVGLGVNTGGISTIHTTGGMQRTEKPTDLMINGEGFFTVSDDTSFTNRFYTRDGSFGVDAVGNLVTSDGYKVLGYRFDQNGKRTDEPGSIVINKSETVAPTATKGITFKGNLNANTKEAKETMTTFIYDSLGNQYELSFDAVKGKTDGEKNTSWDIELTRVKDVATGNYKDISGDRKRIASIKLENEVIDKFESEQLDYLDLVNTFNEKLTIYNQKLADYNDEVQNLNSINQRIMNEENKINDNQKIMNEEEEKITAAQIVIDDLQSTSDEVAAATTARDNAVIAKNSAKTERDNAVIAKNSAETERDNAVIAKNSAETAKNSAETAKNSAETAKNDKKVEIIESSKDKGSMKRMLDDYEAAISAGTGASYLVQTSEKKLDNVNLINKLEAEDINFATSFKFDDKGNLIDPIDSEIQASALAGLKFNKDKEGDDIDPISPTGAFENIQVIKADDPETYSNITQYANDTDLKPYKNDGNSSGTLDGFTIDPSGVIMGKFTNGEQKALGQVMLTKFDNPMGLEKQGGNLFTETRNSGEPQNGVANTRGFGSIAGGTLEMSNVDISYEFTEMITTQRGFQANSRVITTSDEMLQELVNIKR